MFMPIFRTSSRARRTCFMFVPLSSRSSTRSLPCSTPNCMNSQPARFMATRRSSSTRFTRDWQFQSGCMFEPWMSFIKVRMRSRFAVKVSSRKL